MSTYYVNLPLRYNYVALFWQCELHFYINVRSYLTPNRLSKSFQTASPCPSSSIPSITVWVRRPFNTSSSVAFDDLSYFLRIAGFTAACRWSELVRDFSLQQEQKQPYILLLLNLWVGGSWTARFRLLTRTKLSSCRASRTFRRPTYPCIYWTAMILWSV